MIILHSVLTPISLSSQHRITWRSIYTRSCYDRVDSISSWSGATVRFKHWKVKNIKNKRGVFKILYKLNYLRENPRELSLNINNRIAVSSFSLLTWIFQACTKGICRLHVLCKIVFLKTTGWRETISSRPRSCEERKHKQMKLDISLAIQAKL